MYIDTTGFKEDSPSGGQGSEYESEMYDDPFAVAIVEQLVMRSFGIALPTLMSARRGRASVAFARQVAIYLTHVHLGVSLTKTARLFGRDRTTAAHACRCVEDRRETPAIDRRVEALEIALDHWLTSRKARRELLQ